VPASASMTVMARPSDLDLEHVAALADFEGAARARLPREVIDYVAGGSFDEVTLADNVGAFRRRRFRPRVLVETSRIDTASTLLGFPVAAPFGICPMALQGLLHPDGELAMARAAATAGIAMLLSTVSSRSLEEVAAAGSAAGVARDGDGGGGPRWFQLYVHRERALSRTLVERAAAAGYAAIVLTVDLPVMGHRDSEIRRIEALGGTYGNFADQGVDGADLDQLIDMRHATLTWDDVAEIASWTDLPLVIKGILVGEDARIAMESGAAAVVVSNHGGRQLDRAPASLDALSEVVAAVAGRGEVYLDGGVRRGTDVVTALALGADAVFVGRPMAWALAAAGEPGVARAIALLRQELETTMALLGTPSIASITRGHVAAEPGGR